MIIQHSQTPAKAVGEHISKLIAEAHSDAVVLLSGGSALDVFEFIEIPDKSECRIIFMMVDERVSGEETVNNYLQLKKRYRKHPLINSVIDTSGNKNETPEIFAERIRKIFIYDNFSNLSEPKVIAVLGVGSDGHTAGIFPLVEESFTKTYPANATYVPVHLKGLTIDSRASFTPSWLLEHCDVMIGYMAGESKLVILESLKNESKPLFERPAEIFKLHKNSVVYTDQSL